MSSEDFESMVQSLLERTYRTTGTLIQFGTGQDGAREATWSQPTTHPEYKRPTKRGPLIPKEWVFQVKYHDIDLRGWVTARDAVIADIHNELDKLINKYKVPCHAFVLATNVPFTGVLNVGTRDRVTATIRKWKKKVPQILIWDAADLSRMLDANADVRSAYIETILPGDTLRKLFSGASFDHDRRLSAYKAYLSYVTERESAARAEEAGDDPGLPLSEVYIDLPLTAC